MKNHADPSDMKLLRWNQGIDVFRRYSYDAQVHRRLLVEEFWDTIKLIGIQLEDMGQVMADRKNLKINQDTFDELAAEKRDDETWDGFFRRLLDQPDQETMIREALRDELRRFVEERENK